MYVLVLSIKPIAPVFCLPATLAPPPLLCKCLIKSIVKNCLIEFNRKKRVNTYIT